MEGASTRGVRRWCVFCSCACCLLLKRHANWEKSVKLGPMSFPSTYIFSGCSGQQCAQSTHASYWGPRGWKATTSPCISIYSVSFPLQAIYGNKRSKNSFMRYVCAWAEVEGGDSWRGTSTPTGKRTQTFLTHNLLLPHFFFFVKSHGFKHYSHAHGRTHILVQVNVRLHFNEDTLRQLSSPGGKTKTNFTRPWAYPRIFSLNKLTWKSVNKRQKCIVTGEKYQQFIRAAYLALDSCYKHKDRAKIRK